MSINGSDRGTVIHANVENVFAKAGTGLRPHALPNKPPEEITDEAQIVNEARQAAAIYEGAVATSPELAPLEGRKYEDPLKHVTFRPEELSAMTDKFALTLHRFAGTPEEEKEFQKAFQDATRKSQQIMATPLQTFLAVKEHADRYKVLLAKGSNRSKDEQDEFKTLKDVAEEKQKRASLYYEQLSFERANQAHYSKIKRDIVRSCKVATVANNPKLSAVVSEMAKPAAERNLDLLAAFDDDKYVNKTADLVIRKQVANEFQPFMRVQMPKNGAYNTMDPKAMKTFLSTIGNAKYVDESDCSGPLVDIMKKIRETAELMNLSHSFLYKVLPKIFQGGNEFIIHEHRETGKSFETLWNRLLDLESGYTAPQAYEEKVMAILSHPTREDDRVVNVLKSLYKAATYVWPRVLSQMGSISQPEADRARERFIIEKFRNLLFGRFSQKELHEVEKHATTLSRTTETNTLCPWDYIAAVKLHLPSRFKHDQCHYILEHHKESDLEVYTQKKDKDGNVIVRQSQKPNKKKKASTHLNELKSGQPAQGSNTGGFKPQQQPRSQKKPQNNPQSGGQRKKSGGKPGGDKRPQNNQRKGNGSAKPKGKPLCIYCNQNDHSLENCPQAQAAPPNTRSALRHG